MGWRGKGMPTKVMFRDLCGALRASGYDADAAANLWNSACDMNRKQLNSSGEILAYMEFFT